MHPLARTQEISIEQIGEEAIVYDRRAKKAHCLNKASFAVWKKSDGATSVGALTQMLAEQCRLPEDQEIVLFALHELRTAGLLEDADTAGLPSTDAPTRRELGKRLLLLSALSGFPAIASVAAPTPAMARSGDLHSGPGGQGDVNGQNTDDDQGNDSNWIDGDHGQQKDQGHHYGYGH